MTADAGPSSLASLRAALGERVFALDSPLRVGGSTLTTRVEPADAEELATCLRILSEAREPVLVMGAGTRMDLGNPVRGVSTALSCRRLAGIVEFDPSDGVVQVSAGTPLAELAGIVEAEGWLLPLDPPDRGGTVGGVLATAICGPRQRGFGPVRDAVLGIDTVLASGERTRCGARVVKNVTGYDMAKLYVGSLGTLGVTERAWLRLKPIPASLRVVELAVAPDEDAFSLALAAARRNSARAVALLGEPAESPRKNHGHRRIVAEFAGEPPATEADADWLSRGRGEVSDAGTAIDDLRRLQAQPLPGGLRARIHVLPGRLAAAWEKLQDLGAELLAYPEPGVIHARFGPGEDEGDFGWLSEVLEALEGIRAGLEAEVVLEALPDGAATERDVFAGARGLDLMRSIKQRFDPAGILNPGRFAGRI